MRVYDELEGGVNYESTPVNNDFVEIKEDLAAVRQILEEQKAQQIEQEEQEQEQEQAEQEQEQEQAEQEQEQEQSEQDPVIDLTFLDPCDHSLYLSSEVQYANINDLYSMALSIRNILLLFFLFFCVFKMSSMLKAMLYKILNR